MVELLTGFAHSMSIIVPKWFWWMSPVLVQYFSNIWFKASTTRSNYCRKRSICMKELWILWEKIELYDWQNRIEPKFLKLRPNKQITDKFLMITNKSTIRDLEKSLRCVLVNFNYNQICHTFIVNVFSFFKKAPEALDEVLLWFPLEDWIK